MEILKLPVGIENFEDIRRSGFYYIDKTMFIEQFLNTWSEVTLFTRPRRFGFTDKDVQEILTYFNLSEHYADVKEWYDGYHFGNANVYCPWDVINYVDLLRLEPTAKPQDFWSNSSENALVRNFIDKANVQTKYEIERLIAGEYIEKEISQELTYDEIDKSIANLWSVLFTTGYLTKQGVTDDGRVRLSIPNREIKNLFIKKIREWFSDTTANDGKTLEQFCNAFVDKDTERHLNNSAMHLWIRILKK